VRDYREWIGKRTKRRDWFHIEQNFAARARWKLPPTREEAVIVESGNE
jgi:hypothetical protein